MNGYEQAGYQQASSAVTVVPEGGASGGWYGDQTTAPPATETQPEQQGFSIPTTAQTNGGGPMRQGRGASRFNPMGRGKMGGGVGDMAPVSAIGAEKNELGFIIFAYNIGYQTDEGQVTGLFQPYGTVAKVNVIQDFNTGMNKGYAFVTMPDQTEAEAAVGGLNGQSFNGNTLQVRFKTPKGQGPPAGAIPQRGRGGMRGRGMRGGGMRGGMRGGGFSRGRGGTRGAPRGRGRGAYSAAPSAYDYGYSQASYDQYAYADPSAYGSYDYAQTADPYAAGSYASAGSGYASYGAGAW